MDILKMIEDLRTELEHPKQFFGLYWGFQREESIMLLSKIRASLPEQVKSADKLTKESERIIAGAQQDAQANMDRALKDVEKIVADARVDAARIVEQATIQQARMVDESEVLRLSQAQSKELLDRAQDELRALKRGADQYAVDVLDELEQAVSRVMNTIQNGKERLDRKLPEKAETVSR
jgi:vacuolar-type H+-ATPase subunit H